MYNETVLDHFNNPRNVGKIEDGVIGEVSSPGCGDTTFIYLDIEDGVIKDIKFKTFGLKVVFVMLFFVLVCLKKEKNSIFNYFR